MAEPRREEDVEAVGTPDRHRRAKPQRLCPSPGPFSSIRAAIKRTRTNSPSENIRGHRRPEIKVISAEPLVNRNWFSGASFPLPPPSDSANGLQPKPPPSYEQVIKEKTGQSHVVKPTPAPRQHTRTTTFTQTEATAPPVPQSSPSELSAGRSKGKTPQKPPRPLLPRKAPSGSSSFSTDKGLSKSDLLPPKKEADSPTSTQSVIVHWDVPADSCPVGKVVDASETPVPYPNPGHSPHPVPHPRIKSRKQPNTEQTDFQTLIHISENSDSNQSDQQDTSSNKYLKELLEVFQDNNDCEEGSGTVFLHGEDDLGDMSNTNSQRSFQARIQAFESQASNAEDHIYETIQPQPLPRKSNNKPPVTAKPPVALKPQFSNSRDDGSQNESSTNATSPPLPAPRPQGSRNPMRDSIKNELEALHSKGPIPGRPRSVLSRATSVYQEDALPGPPALPVQPVKEPPRANPNINNHNSARGATPNEYVDGTSNTKRDSMTRRPTTIRVPSKTGSISDNVQDFPPPLPVQNPVGSLNNRRSLSLQDSFNAAPEPCLPPRKPSMKSLPPRPPPAKTGPRASPRPHSQTLSHSASWDGSPVPQTQRSHREGLGLPPRPKPGHRLYNKYTLQLPHGIASYDYNGKNSEELSFQKNEVLLLLGELDQNYFQCQTGATQGRVSKAHMKVITSLPVSETLVTGGGASAEDGIGLTVQAVFDFIPEGPGELGLRAGDVVTMVEQVDSQWYKGTCGGAAGFFPVNYVQILSNSPKPLPERKPRPGPEPISGPRCVARFDFKGEHSDELSFSEGDVILLKEYMQQDWAKGQLGDLTGIFPLNYVDVIEDLPASSSQEPTTKIPLPGMVGTDRVHHQTANPPQESQSDLGWAVALYDYTGNSEDDLSFKQGDSILITQHLSPDWSCGRIDNREGMFPVSFVEPKSGQHLAPEQDGEAGAPRAKALYNFTSDSDEELSLQAGDILTNLESIDEEWFMGDLKGKRGLFPKNYVQVLG